MLGALPAHVASSSFAVAFSGGADSTALLAALHEAGVFEFRALHFNHRINSESAAWQSHCEILCKDLGIAIESGVWEQSPGPDCSEAEARDARYRWLSGRLGEGEVLLTAHHADDQAETVLLNMLQGRGLHRLAGMQPVRPLNQHLLVRPLLGVSHRALVDYLRRRDLHWIEDPANFSDRHQRSFLRQRIMPLLRERFVGCDENLGRSANRLREAVDVVQRLVEDTLTRIQRPAQRRLFCIVDPIDATRLVAEDAVVGRNVIREWVHRAGVSGPRDSEIEELLRQLHGAAGSDSSVALRFNDMEILLHDDTLYLLDQMDEMDRSEQLFSSARTTLPGGLEVALEPAATPGLSAETDSDTSDLRWRWRQGGERIRLPARAHSQSLKKLYQENRVPRFERDALPLLWAGEELLWVHGIGFSDRLSTLPCRGTGDDNFEPVFRYARIDRRSD